MSTVTSTSATLDRPPFILSQGMRLLTETTHPKRYLSTEDFRAGRQSQDGGEGRGGSGRQQNNDVWVPVDRLDVALDQLTIGGQPVSLDRMVYVTDAGIGKTTNLRWTFRQLCDEQAGRLAFCLPMAELVPEGAVGPHWDVWVRAKLLSIMQQSLPANAPLKTPPPPANTRLPGIMPHSQFTPVGKEPKDPLGTLFDRLLAAGKIVVMLDALDQIPVNSQALPALEYVLGDAAWQHCRFILAARPHALDRHWNQLFAAPGLGWRFVQLDEFTDPQQRAYLGRAHGASRDRLDMIVDVIDPEAKQILTIPRVLEMIRKIPIDQLASLRTTSDVYWRSVCYLVNEGLADSKARMLGAPVGSLEPLHSIVAADVALMLLSALAFEMVATRVPLAKYVQHKVRGREWWDKTHGLYRGTHVPNFDRVNTDDFEAFRQRVFGRIGTLHYAQYAHFKHDLWRLEAMNTFLSHGLLDVGELSQLQFRNRSLQEFLAALWMARHCSEEDSAEVRTWLYRKDEPLSEEYYWIWRFATEMPIDGRQSNNWVRAMRPLYLTGDGTVDNKIRCTEMIYRSWSTVEHYQDSGEPSVRQQAENLLSSFQGEFSRIMSARYIYTGMWRWWVARRLVAGFRSIPAGEFTMGSAASEDGRLSDEVQHHVRFTQAFLMHRYQVTNSQYELFDPGHLANRDKYSKADNQPVIDVSWYDAWCFAKWVYYDGKCCSLPTEAEWEYSCRAGTTTRFWSGSEDKDLDRAGWHLRNAGRATHPVGEKAANAWGLYDTHGNVWEWCVDWYGTYPSGSEKDPVAPKTGHSRVLRGGSFYSNPQNLRTANRLNDSPESRNLSVGFRISRTP